MVGLLPMSKIEETKNVPNIRAIQICGSMEGKEDLNVLESFNKKKEEKENTGDFSKMQKRHVCVCQVKI